MASDRDQQDNNRGRHAERDPTLPNPVSLFDYHLRVLENSYISFFQERVRIEEQFIAGLAALQQKSRYFDTQVVDPALDNTTLRKAWREARENVDKEAESRGALVAALKSDVLGPLTQLKESQDRSRKRIKEDIKESYQAHVEYQENVLPRLKQKYLKKVQDVEEYRNMERPFVQGAGFGTIPQTLSLPAPSSPTSSSHTVPSNGPSVSGSPPKPPLPAPSPQPPMSSALVQTNNRPTGFAPTPRNRSPSASTSLSDLAHQGKKALKGLLPENRDGRVLNSMRENLGGEGRNPALKNVRNKREAEEADKDYRKGVHWLETLRLRRVNTIRSGYTSLEDFIWEEGVIVKGALQKYVDCLIGTASTGTQLIGHVQASLAGVALERDRVTNTQSFANVDGALKRAIPQTLYYNYLVGDCKDLIFGTGLVDYATERGVTGGPGVALGLNNAGKKDGGGPKAEGKGKSDAIGRAEEAVPRLVRLCIHDIDSRGLLTEGIYRVSGRHANVQELRHLVERDESLFELNPQTDDVYCVSSLLKQYLRELPEPVFRFPLQERMQHTKDRDDHISSNFRLLRGKIRRLPPIHQATLRLVIEHLARIASHSSVNKMDAKNLSIVFGTLLFGEEELPTGTDVLSISTWKDTVLEDLINYSARLFEEKPNQSPPLPPAPMEEPASIDYGSAHTKIYAPSPSSLLRRAERDRDFTLDMPVRPDKSIHPNSRKQQKRMSSASYVNVELPSPGPQPEAMENLSANLQALSVKEDHPLPQPPQFLERRSHTHRKTPSNVSMDEHPSTSTIESPTKFDAMEVEDRPENGKAKTGLTVETNPTAPAVVAEGSTAPLLLSRNRSFRSWGETDDSEDWHTPPTSVG